MGSFAKPIGVTNDRPMGIAEFIIGPAGGRTRWLQASYELNSDIAWAKNQDSYVGDRNTSLVDENEVCCS